MLAQARQVHHEGVFKLAVDVFLDVIKVFVLAALGKFATQNFFPVRTPLYFFHARTRDQAARASGRHGLGFGRRLQVRVVKGKGLVVVVNLRQVRVGEDFHQQLPLGPLARFDLAIGQSLPAAVPLVLVFPLLGITDAGFGFDVVEPGVFHAGTAGPDIFAGHRAGVATNAFVQVEHHADLGANFHDLLSFIGIFGVLVGRVSTRHGRLKSTLRKRQQMHFIRLLRHPASPLCSSCAVR
ncbi:hypothetical protein GALL_424050 [mine drainage metagenome]|uniref:Uncharacterized protein n=1 Tax=mine drainage metagenome TaxID=410659 RepID=A0A1J5PYB9_9ZZZZ